MSEQVLTVGGSRASKPISDFILRENMYGPKAGEYYVDGNVSATGDGSIDHPFSTLEEAIAVSDAAIALTANRWWARRNRIYCVGDTLTEDLVKFPTKCDVIGCGSYDGNTKCGLVGNHVPVGESYGTRFFNMWFKSIAVALPIVTLSSEASGVQFIGTTFDAVAGTITNGILSTAMPNLHVLDCDFIGAFATSNISFGAGEAGGARIIGNRLIGSAGTGITVDIGTTTSWESIIDDNRIRCAGLWIDDNSDLFVITNNRAITDIDCATYTAGFDFNLLLASGNIQTGSNAGDCDTVPHLLFA